jgi:antirestriction protein ArdC
MSTEKISVEQKITDLFINGLEQGVVAWQKPWVLTSIGNVSTGNSYTGSNRFWAALHAQMYGVQSHYTTILAAATKLGYKSKGQGWVDSKGNAVPFPIKKGAKGLHLIRVVQISKESKDKDGNVVLDSDGKPKKYSFPTITGFVAFSVDHIVWDLSKYIPKANDNSILIEGEQIVEKYEKCPAIKTSDSAFYSPSLDYIGMPAIGQFKESAGYYRTLFHELIHSTGSSDRLNRAGVANFDTFGSHQYSFEELVAEIGSGMLCEISGVPMDIQNSQAYLNGWISKLKSEPKWIIKAASEARKAVEFILGQKIEQSTEATTEAINE